MEKQVLARQGLGFPCGKNFGKAGIKRGKTCILILSEKKALTLFNFSLTTLFYFLTNGTKLQGKILISGAFSK
ncbi:MAG: hypothetical protein IJN44_09765 [Clostridia bacterium]|nr:hypothetical protein [Clostridia bacterium]